MMLTDAQRADIRSATRELISEVAQRSNHWISGLLQYSNRTISAFLTVSQIRLALAV